MKKQVIAVSLLGLASLALTACGGATAAAAAPTKVNSSSLSAEGKLEPLQSVELSFGINGAITEVLVKEGATVNAGDVIARLDSTAQRNAVAQAEAALAVAQANLAQYQNDLPQQIAAAEAQIKAANAQIAAGAAQRDRRVELTQAEAALAQAVYAQQQAQTAYDKVLEFKKYGTTEETARLALNTAKMNAEAAQARVKQLKSGSAIDRADGAQIAAATAQRDAAQAHLDQLQAEADGKTESTFAAAAKQAEVTVQSAKTALADTELRAPFAGTIAQLNFKQGERVTPGAIKVVLADLSGWRLTTDDLTEAKVPAIKIGQPVKVTTDALPGLELKGEVEAIGAVSQLKGGD
ncbi:MAG TPA: biotin/lipoyl-binding protein, partial [Anaerolineae bacterium]|nr:biotin/lipoyl-binding protein [Anaerolineae bacterium]